MYLSAQWPARGFTLGQFASPSVQMHPQLCLLALFEEDIFYDLD